jgi:transposase
VVSPDDQEVAAMDVVVARCAGLDVHKDTVVACVRTPGPDGDRVSETRTFGTMTVELLTLRDWLVAHGVTLVGMESTGVFWRPVFYTLEDAMECWLLNAQHMRNVPGRKSDVADAGWIAQLVEHGLVRPSFVPPPPIRELRELTRYRKTQIEERTRGAQRLDKSLQDAGLKLSSVASNILGKSGRDMLDALVAGTRDAEVLAELARGRLRLKIPALTRALTGRFGPTHALVVGEILAHLDYLDEAIGRVSARVDEVIRPFVAERELLTTIPGVDKRLAEAIIAEIGVDMTRFGAAARLASWAGMCPGQHESAGKSRSGRARHGDTHLQKHLAVAAMAAACTKDTYLAAQYARLVARRGKAHARKAVGHSILVAAFHILAAGVPYAELGGDYYLKRNSPERRARKNLNDLKALGWTVTEKPDGVSCIPPHAA